MWSPLDRLMVDGLVRVGKQYGGKTGERNPIAQIRPVKKIWDLSSSTIRIIIVKFLYSYKHFC